VSLQRLNGAERRRHSRLDHSIPIRITDGGIDIVTETKNLSSSGAFCLVNKFIAPMTKLKLQFLLPIKKNNKVVNQKVSCIGVVVRSQSAVDQDSFQTAIFFSDIAPRDSQIIHDFVETAMRHEPSST
jgi:hypothetical protein